VEWPCRRFAFTTWGSRRRKPPLVREWQSGGGPAKQRRFFCHPTEEKLSVWKDYIAHIFYIKNLRK
jgi:hypothetical protein